MKIKLKNNPKGTKEDLVKTAEYILTKLIGTDKIKGLGTVTISFKKMGRGIGGRARYSETNDFDVCICKDKSTQETKRIMAHELCHIKQYFLKELTYRREIRFSKRGRLVSRTIRIWKGKEILRSSYFTRKWEVEARKMEALAKDMPVAIKVAHKQFKAKVITVKPTVAIVKDPTKEEALATLSCGKVRNDLFMEILLKGIVNSQERIAILKKVYSMKTENIINEVIVDSIVYIQTV